MGIGPKSDDFDFETTVKDNLMSHNEDVRIDDILGRETNIGHETGEAPIVVCGSFTNCIS